MNKHTTKIALAFTAIYIIWGSTYLAIRYCVETVPPFLMVGLRFSIAGALLYGAARLTGAPRPGRVHWINASIVGVLLITAGNGLVVFSEQQVSSATAALMICTVPLWIALIAWIVRGERPSGQALCGILTGITGTAILVCGTGCSTGSGLHGIFTLLLSALSWASGSVVAKSLELPSSPLVTTSLEMMTGGLLAILTSFCLGEPQHLDVHRISAHSLLAFLYLVVFGSLIGFTAYSWLIKVVSVQRLSTYAYVNPVVALILATCLGGETVTARTMMAAAVILSGVLLMVRAPVPVSSTRTPPDAHTQPSGAGGPVGSTLSGRSILLSEA